MYIELNANGWASVHDITAEQLEVMQSAVLRILDDLPLEEQPPFRRLAMDIDKLIKHSLNT